MLSVAALFKPELLAFGDTGYGDELFRGAVRTVEISVLAYAFGITLGLLGATGKLSGPKWLRRILEGYTTIVRAVPLLVIGKDHLSSYSLRTVVLAYMAPAVVLVLGQ